MVFSFVQQPASTYLEFRRFKYPSAHGPVDAVAVPSAVHDELISAYTFLASIVILKLWAVIVAVWMYYYLDDDQRKKVNDLAMSVWNKRGSPEESFSDKVFYSPTRPGWRFYVLCFAILSVWVANIAAGILVPRTLVIGNAAPVNPMSIYVPDLDYAQSDRIHLSASFALDVPLTLRAAGSALIANASLQQQILVSRPISLGTVNNNGSTEEIQQIQYSYNVSGVDFGLQFYPGLMLKVTGACTTDYTWWDHTEVINNANVDFYIPWNNSDLQEYVSVDDGQQPLGIFITDTTNASPTNFTWGAIISSAGRVSFTESEDPWYRTELIPGRNQSDPTTVPNVVLTARPALSCWENDVWTFDGQTTDISQLGAIPGLGLSDATQKILYRYFSTPRIVSVAQRLRPSNLQSATTSLGGAFDAGSSSLHSDLQRLILAAYVASTNTFTDTTLYPNSGQSGASIGGVTIPNIAQDNFNQPYPGVGEFVVYSTEIATLSVKVLIIVPTVAICLWLLALILLKVTRFKLANAMEGSCLFGSVKRGFPDANVRRDGKGWHFGVEIPRGMEDSVQQAEVVTETKSETQVIEE